MKPFKKIVPRATTPVENPCHALVESRRYHCSEAIGPDTVEPLVHQIKQAIETIMLLLSSQGVFAGHVKAHLEAGSARVAFSGTTIGTVDVRACTAEQPRDVQEGWRLTVNVISLTGEREALEQAFHLIDSLGSISQELL